MKRMYVLLLLVGIVLSGCSGLPPVGAVYAQATATDLMGQSCDLAKLGPNSNGYYCSSQCARIINAPSDVSQVWTRKDMCPQAYVAGTGGSYQSNPVAVVQSQPVQSQNTWSQPASNSVSSAFIPISGGQEFVGQFTRFQQLLKEKDPSGFAYATTYLRLISEDPRVIGVDVVSGIFSVNSEWKSPDADDAWWACVLVHEACHVENGHQLFSTDCAANERMCFVPQIACLRQLGAFSIAADVEQQDGSHCYASQSGERYSR